MSEPIWNQFLTELFASNGVGAWNVTIGDGPALTPA
jgi:hypothetical protein